MARAPRAWAAAVLLANLALLPSLAAPARPVQAAAPIDGADADCKGTAFETFELLVVGPIEAAAALIGEEFRVPEPGWEYVNPSARFRSATGRVEDSHVTHTDFPVNHDVHDHNFEIVLDPGQEDLLSDVQTKLEIEWEINLFPAWVWPSDGDRVWVNGNHIFDCGHPVDQGGVENFKTEIHPPRAVASMRDQVRTLPGSGTTPVAVTATDLYIHGRGGYIVEQLECGIDAIMGVPGGPDTCLGSPGHPHRGVPIDTNFQFDIPLPPKPSAATTVVGMSFENGPGNTLGPNPDLKPMPEGNPTFVRATIPLAGSGATPSDVYARKIYVGWLAPPDNLRHFQVKLTDALLKDDNEPDPGDCECTFIWMNVDRAAAPDEWMRLNAFDIPTDDDAGFPCPSHTNTLADWDDEEDCGNGRLNFNGPTFDFYVANNRPFTVKFHGYEQDCFDSVYGFPHNLVAQAPLLLDCYANPVNFFNPGDNDDMGEAKQTFSGPGYATGGRSAENGNYRWNFTLTQVPLTNEDSADLRVAKSCAPDPVKAPGPFTCTVEVTNAGPGLPREVVLTDTLTTAVPASQYEIESATFVFQGVASPPPAAPCAIAGNKATCSLGTVPLAPAKAVVTMSVTSNEGGKFTNKATVSAASTDPSTGNNEASDEVTVIAQANLALTKTATPSPVLAGGELTYTVTSTNQGPSTAQDVSITDTLPALTLFKSATPSAGGTCTKPPIDGTGTVQCSWSGATAAGVARSVTIVVEVGGPGSVINKATTTSATEDPNPANNAASATTQIICTIDGTPGNDVLAGTDGFDVICGLGGNDVIDGLGGNDRIFGGPGNDNIDGGPGNDRLWGEEGNDNLSGGDGNDQLQGGSGEDALNGGDGADDLRGGDNDDRLLGDDGDDKLSGDAGNDILNAGSGVDDLNGGTGTDVCTDQDAKKVGGGATGCESGP